MNLADNVVTCVSDYYGVPEARLKSRDRSRDATHARFVAMYLLRKECPALSLKMIGRRFGNRDHSTVSNALKAVQDMRDTLPTFVQELEAVKKQIYNHSGAVESALINLRAEMRVGLKKFGPYSSWHEAYGVIKEEFDELWDSIKADAPAPHEALQVAATAMRCYIEMISGVDYVEAFLTAEAPTTNGAVIDEDGTN